MADNVGIITGSGATIKTDSVSGSAHVQLVKLVDGTLNSDSRIPGTSTHGLKVQTYVQKRIRVTPTITSTTYSAGDAVGGLLTFSNAARFSGGGGFVSGCSIVDKDQERAGLALVLFDRTFTATADNDPFDPSDADLQNVICVLPIGVYTAFNDNAVGQYAGAAVYPYVANGSDLFGQLVLLSSSAIYGTASDIDVVLTVHQE